MKQIVALGFSFLLAVSGFAQKTTSQTFNAGNTKEIYILTDEVYKINIVTSAKKQVKIRTISTGEYYNNIALDVKRTSERMEITSNFPEILQSGYDKLSAHKVFSLELFIEVPEGMKVYVESNIASVQGQGKYKELIVELQSGFCTLFNFSGDARVNTYGGSINVTAKNAEIEADSRHGRVDLPPSSNGKNHLRLTSINGDIKVQEN